MADKLETDDTLTKLAQALTLQAESILTMTHLAGTLRGMDGAAVNPSCARSCRPSWRTCTC